MAQCLSPAGYNPVLFDFWRAFSNCHETAYRNLDREWTSQTETPWGDVNKKSSEDPFSKRNSSSSEWHQIMGLWINHYTFTAVYYKVCWKERAFWTSWSLWLQQKFFWRSLRLNLQVRLRPVLGSVALSCGSVHKRTQCVTNEEAPGCWVFKSRPSVKYTSSEVLIM